jgi:AcrR family transcriptional regulator
MSPRTKAQLEEIRIERSGEISEAALRLFAAKGFQNTSIREIADEAGISKGLIYNYYSSKEEILKSLINTVFDTMWKRFGFDIDRKLTDQDYIDFINLSIDIVIEDLDHYKLWFSVLTQPKVLAMVMDDMWVKAAPVMHRMEEYYTDKGYEDPIAQMRFASAIIDGIQMHIMLDPVNFPIERVREILIQHLTAKI